MCTLLQVQASQSNETMVNIHTGILLYISDVVIYKINSKL